jgi:ATP-dependent Clp protease adapter protein ClpS
MKVTCLYSDGNSEVSQGKEYKVLKRPSPRQYTILILNDDGTGYEYPSNWFTEIIDGEPEN